MMLHQSTTFIWTLLPPENDKVWSTADAANDRNVLITEVSIIVYEFVNKMNDYVKKFVVIWIYKHTAFVLWLS
jgi:hypothetical protein